MSNIKIRKACKEDMPKVLELIKELAAFENLQDQVKIDHSVLEADGFGCGANNPLFECFVATVRNDVNETDDESEEIVGYALYYFSYSTWTGKAVFLEDLYVKPKHRLRGIGKHLFLSVARIANSIKCRLDFHVLAWNPAAEFYKSLGAVNLTQSEEWHMFRLEGEKLQELFCERQGQ